ncbi:hypothetical protein BG003_001232 [Podila horticola]|nr:hypothetical protein BG003_001232 [Podila horticola]
MQSATETLSSPSKPSKLSPNSDLGAQILATRTYGIYVGLYLGLVLCCDHYRLHLYQSFTILILGSAVLWSAYPSFPTLETKQDNDEPSTSNTANSPITIDTQDAIATNDAVWSPKTPVFLISTSFPNVSWTETVSPGDDPPPPYASFPTKGVHHYPPSIFRSILNMTGLVISMGTLVYMTFIDTTHLAGPTSDIARGIIGMVVVCCGYKLAKDMMSAQHSTPPSTLSSISLKGHSGSTVVQEKALETKLDAMKLLEGSLEQEKGCSAVVNVNDDEATCLESSLAPWLELALLEATSKYGEDELFGEHELFDEKDKDEGQEQNESDETDHEQKQQQKEPVEDFFLSLLELQESQEEQQTTESQESQESMTEDLKWRLEFVCRKVEDRKHPKDLHRATRQCSFDMRSPERPLPRLVSSVSFDSFLPFFAPVDMPVNEDLLRIAPLPEKGHKELVAFKKRQLAKRPHTQQREQEQHIDEGTIVSKPPSLEHSQSLISTSRRKSDLFTISLFVLPSMIRRPLMLFSRSPQTTFSVHGQHISGETNWDAEYDIIKQGEWNAETTPRQLQRSSTSVSLSRRPNHMKHKRGLSESSGPSTLRSRRSFFTLESDTLQSIFQFYRRRQAATTRNSSEAVDDTTSEPEEERIAFVVRSNVLPTVRVGLYGTQKRMWTSAGSMVFEPEADEEAQAPSIEHN